MKTCRCSLLLASMVCLVTGQELTTEDAASASTAAKAQAAELKTKKESDALIARKPVLYGGFVTDLKKSTNAPKLLSLRKPNDPKTDQQNVHFDAKTGRAKGFVLFSLSF